MSEIVIRTEGLVKDYGSVRALAGLDLEVQGGEIFGFLGPVGAGKSATIGWLLDLLGPAAGGAGVLGATPAEGGPALRARIGYLPGELAMSGKRTAGDLLRHLALLRGGAGTDGIATLADRLGLELDRPIRGLSKGNKQKIGVVQAFMHDPQVLVLELASGVLVLAEAFVANAFGYGVRREGRGSPRSAGAARAARAAAPRPESSRYTAAPAVRSAAGNNGSGDRSSPSSGRSRTYLTDLPSFSVHSHRQRVGHARFSYPARSLGGSPVECNPERDYPYRGHLRGCQFRPSARSAHWRYRDRRIGTAIRR